MGRTSFFPDFFIVGAPRCGTTSMRRYLKHRRDVLLSIPKEPHFFTHLLPKDPGVDIERAYVDRFFTPERRKDRHRIVGEASTTTLYSAEAIKHILEYNPRARFIAMVRNPLEMLVSYHRLLLFQLQEDVEDLRIAWALQGLRARGRHLPPHTIEPRTLQYAQIGRLGAHVEQLLGLTGPDQTHVVVYDDLKRDPLGVYREVLEFLGLEYDGREEFPTRRAGMVYRSRRFHEWIFRGPAQAGGLDAYLEQRVRDGRASGKTAARKRYRGWLLLNTRPARPEPMDPDLRRVIVEALSDDVERLGRLLGRELGHWLRPTPAMTRRSAGA